MLAQLRFFIKLDMDDGQMPAKDWSCSTSGSKVMTRTVSKLKMRSKKAKVVSVGFKLTKFACRASGIGSSAVS